MVSISSELKKPGKLVKFRGRRCIVQPSLDDDIVILKPLGASGDELMAVYQPILQHHDEIANDQFDPPSIDDLNSFLTAKLLYDAARLSFRQVSGPFRCMGKLSFRPRSYQIVPLVMALKQPVTRQLIADDVGIGKTIEALLILRELLERGTIKNFAVLCPPHLCEQWQKELADKLDIDAEIIRSSTVAGLERKIVGDDTLNVFNYYPYKVVSIDYVKSDNKKPVFLNDLPDLIIVDEAHACAKPQNQIYNQQLRYHLLKDISENPDRHLILLTATPHSGKDEEFQSLLGLLKPELETYTFENLSQAEKKKIADHFIQRRRKNIETWLNEETIFPERSTKELFYKLSTDYFSLYEDVLKFARGISSDYINNNKARIKYFAALTLLRGVMSSPDTGFEMLQNRKQKIKNEDLEELKDNPNIERLEDQSDVEQIELIDKSGLTESEWKRLHKLSDKIKELYGPGKDHKIKTTTEQLKKWVSNGQSPIIFCRFIKTAHYVADCLKDCAEFKNVDIRAITSELPDEERKERIDEMSKSSKRILVATDCLSEGINLQDKFNAVLHYDLPWNPNRLEQREGRVDRFGQPGWKDKSGKLQNLVEVIVLIGEDNPIDKIVLKVIIEKIRKIRRSSGVSISFPENNLSVMDLIIKEVLINAEQIKDQDTKQMRLDFDGGGQLSKYDHEITNEIEKAKEKAETIRSIFAHESIKPEEIENDLKEVDEAIGDVATLENFVVSTVKLLGGKITPVTDGYIFQKQNMDSWLAERLGSGEKIHISFKSPTPLGYCYIGRNHGFVEQLCNRLIANSLEQDRKDQKAARASVFRTDSVTTQTTLIQFRVRNVIKEASKKHELVSEEMFLWGYEHIMTGIKVLDIDTCKNLLNISNAIDISKEKQKEIFSQELVHFKDLHQDFIRVVENRAEELVKAHTRFSKFLGAKRFEAVTPVLPPDILGVYVLIPNPKV